MGAGSYRSGSAFHRGSAGNLRCHAGVINKLGIEVDDVEGGRRERKGGGHPMTWPSGTTTWRDANGEVDILMLDELDQAAMMVAFANQLRQQAGSGCQPWQST